MSKQSTAARVLELARQSSTMPELRSKIAAAFAFPSVNTRLTKGTHRVLFPLPDGLVMKSCVRPYYPEHDGLKDCLTLLEKYATLDSNDIEYGLSACPEFQQLLPQMWGHYVSGDWVGHEDCSCCERTTDLTIAGNHHIRWEPQHILASEFPALAAALGQSGQKYLDVGSSTEEPVSGINILIADFVSPAPAACFDPASKYAATVQNLKERFDSLQNNEIGLTGDDRLVALDAGCGVISHSVQDYVRAYALALVALAFSE